MNDNARTGWKCEACLCCGVLSHDEHAGVYEVVNLLEAEHARVSPDCKLNLSSIRVWKIPSGSHPDDQPRS